MVRAEGSATLHPARPTQLLAPAALQGQLPYATDTYVLPTGCSQTTKQLKNIFSIVKHTERRGRVLNTPTSYSRGSGFNVGPETGYPN
jgi:hypothetical protein